LHVVELNDDDDDDVRVINKLIVLQGRTSQWAGALSTSWSHFWTHFSAAGDHDNSQRRVQRSISRSDCTSSPRPQVRVDKAAVCRLVVVQSFSHMMPLL